MSPMLQHDASMLCLAAVLPGASPPELCAAILSCLRTELPRAKALGFTWDDVYDAANWQIFHSVLKLFLLSSGRPGAMGPDTEVRMLAGKKNDD